MSLGTPEIVVCLLIALLVLGPDKLPTAARQIGKALSEFKRITSDVQGQVQTFINEAPQKDKPQSPGGPVDQVATQTGQPLSVIKDEPATRIEGQAGNAPGPVSPPAAVPDADTSALRHPGTEGFRLIDDNPPVLGGEPTYMPKGARPEPEDTEEDTQQPWRSYGASERDEQ